MTTLLSSLGIVTSRDPAAGFISDYIPTSVYTIWWEKLDGTESVR